MGEEEWRRKGRGKGEEPKKEEEVWEKRSRRGRVEVIEGEWKKEQRWKEGSGAISLMAVMLVLY